MDPLRHLSASVHDTIDAHRLSDEAAHVYRYVRSLGNPGDEVSTSTHGFLMHNHGIDADEARRVRDTGTRHLKSHRLIERIDKQGNVVARSVRLRILPVDCDGCVGK